MKRYRIVGVFADVMSLKSINVAAVPWVRREV